LFPQKSTGTNVTLNPLMSNGSGISLKTVSAVTVGAIPLCLSNVTATNEVNQAL
jgi:hypothetical protein